MEKLSLKIERPILPKDPFAVKIQLRSLQIKRSLQTKKDLKKSLRNQIPQVRSFRLWISKISEAMDL
jgi:hypothetical protein